MEHCAGYKSWATHWKIRLIEWLSGPFETHNFVGTEEAAKVKAAELLDGWVDRDDTVTYAYAENGAIKATILTGTGEPVDIYAAIVPRKEAP